MNNISIRFTVHHLTQPSSYLSLSALLVVVVIEMYYYYYYKWMENINTKTRGAITNTTSRRRKEDSKQIRDIRYHTIWKTSRVEQFIRYVIVISNIHRKLCSKSWTVAPTVTLLFLQINTYLLVNFIHTFSYFSFYSITLFWIITQCTIYC